MKECAGGAQEERGWEGRGSDKILHMAYSWHGVREFFRQFVKHVCMCVCGVATGIYGWSRTGVVFACAMVQKIWQLCLLLLLNEAGAAFYDVGVVFLGM